MTYLAEPRSYGVSGKQFRYIHYANDNEELYEPGVDRYEWTNLANKPEFASQLEMFRKQSPTEFAPLIAASVGSLVKLKWRPAGDTRVPPSKPVASPFDVFFINEHSESVNLYWMDPKGKPVTYGEIGVGQQKRQSTRPGAVWLVTDKNENRLGHFEIDDRSARAIMMAVAY